MNHVRVKERGSVTLSGKKERRKVQDVTLRWMDDGRRMDGGMKGMRVTRSRRGEENHTSVVVDRERERDWRWKVGRKDGAGPGNQGKREDGGMEDECVLNESIMINQHASLSLCFSLCTKSCTFIFPSFWFHQIMATKQTPKRADQTWWSSKWFITCCLFEDTHFRVNVNNWMFALWFRRLRVTAGVKEVGKP